MINKLDAADKPHILNTLNDKEYCTPDIMSKRYHVSKRELFIQCITNSRLTFYVG